MRIIPALDIIDGKCVRLTKGDFSSKKIYNDDPVAVAREVEDNGLKYLHLVDLDGAKNKKVTNIKVLEKISASTKLKIDFGGGVRTIADLTAVFNAGASQVTGGSIAVNNKPLFLTWLREFGPEKIILGADSLGMKISTCGWTETSEKDILNFITEYRQAGIKYVICTDISRDGMLGGPSTDLYREILATTDVSLIASGGVSSVKDIEDLDKAGCEGVIIGKAIYEGKLSLKELGNIC